ncbi:hypothetical protein ACLOJK_027411 [Asimina triloba]
MILYVMCDQAPVVVGSAGKSTVVRFHESKTTRTPVIVCHEIDYRGWKPFAPQKSSSSSLSLACPDPKALYSTELSLLRHRYPMLPPSLLNLTRLTVLKLFDINFSGWIPPLDSLKSIRDHGGL